VTAVYSPCCALYPSSINSTTFPYPATRIRSWELRLHCCRQYPPGIASERTIREAAFRFHLNAGGVFLSDEPNWTMSVIYSRPERSPVAYEAMPHQGHVVMSNYKQPYAVSIESVSTRSPSVSSYSSNFSNYSTYSNSTAPTIHSPTLPSSPRLGYRLFKQPSQPPRVVEPAVKRLPSPVYDCILNQLQSLHEATHQTGCTTCFQRDLHSLALTSRTWEKAVRSKL
jgi:hypothetical protein